MYLLDYNGTGTTQSLFTKLLHNISRNKYNNLTIKLSTKTIYNTTHEFRQFTD